MQTKATSQKSSYNQWGQTGSLQMFPQKGNIDSAFPQLFAPMFQPAVLSHSPNMTTFQNSCQELSRGIHSGQSQIQGVYDKNVEFSPSPFGKPPLHQFIGLVAGTILCVFKNALGDSNCTFAFRRILNNGSGQILGIKVSAVVLSVFFPLQ